MDEIKIYCPECNALATIDSTNQTIYSVTCNNCQFTSSRYVAINTWDAIITLSPDFRIYLDVTEKGFYGELQVAQPENPGWYRLVKTISSVDEGKKLFQYKTFL